MTLDIGTTKKEIGKGIKDFDLSPIQPLTLDSFKKTMKTYDIPCFWQMAGNLRIEADSLEDAIAQAEEDDMPLPEGGYVTASFQVDHEGLEDWPDEDLLEESLLPSESEAQTLEPEPKILWEQDTYTPVAPLARRPIAFKWFCPPARGFVENYKYRGSVDELFLEDPHLHPVQFTGVDGLYEGDILELALPHLDVKYLGIIAFRDGAFYFKVHNPTGTLSSLWLFEFPRYQATYTLVGNIYENPEKLAPLLAPCV